MSDIKFGTGGWRAVIGEGFTEENVRRVAAGIARWLYQNGKRKLVFVGYDRRKFSKEAAHAVCDELRKSGVRALCSHTYIASPAAMYVVKEYDLDCGLMVTASHNPPEYNGIKVFIHGGQDAPKEITEQIEECILEGPMENGRSKPTIPVNISDGFQEFVQSRLHIHSEKKLNIALDVMFGSAKEPFVTIAEQLGHSVTVLNDGERPDDRQGLPSPEQQYIPELMHLMQSGAYHLGVAFDGDGDRIGLVDDEGEYLDANDAMCMMYWYLHEVRHESGCVVKNLCTTERLKTMAAEFNEECYDVPVGFKWISAKMLETNALLGGESSGGMTFRDYLLGKDSTLTALMFVEMIVNTGMKLSEIKQMMRDKYGRSYFLTDNIRFDPERKNAIFTTLLTKLPPLYTDVYGISHMDGIKISFNNNDFLSVRFSGTEPLLRIMAEAHTKEDAERYIQTCKTLIE